jgi:hypothetical protein
VWERVVEGVGEQRTKAIRCGACYYSIVLKEHRVTSMADTDIDAVKKRNNAERIVVMCIGYIFLTCDMYKSSLRHIHDPVLSSLKMKGIRFFFFFLHFAFCILHFAQDVGVIYICDISSFSREVNENCALPGYYAASVAIVQEVGWT